MALKSKNSQGNNRMYIQASGPEAKAQESVSLPPGQSSIRSPDSSSSEEKTVEDTSDSIAMGDDFYSIYSDNVLESALADRGFSQLRPEILGSFEFVSPLTVDSKDVSEDSGQVVYNSTGAGELLDMQNQLKQLRYSETMHFLMHKCGLLQGSAFHQPSKDSAGAQVQGIVQEADRFYQTNAIGESPTFTNNDLQSSSTSTNFKNYVYSNLDSIQTLYPNAPKGATAISIQKIISDTDNNESAGNETHIPQNMTPDLLMSFKKEMRKADTILDFLSSSLSIYDFKTAINIKINNYVTKNSINSTASSGIIASKMNLYDDDFVSNKAPGNISLQSYLKDYLKIPEDYWNNASSTALMMQLVADTVGRTVYPQEDFSTFSPIGSDSFSPGEILGINKNSYGGYETLKQLGKIDLTELDQINYLYKPDARLGTTQLDNDESGTEMFTRGDFFNLWDRLIDQKDSKLLYVASRDFINHCHTKSVNKGSESPNTQNSSSGTDRADSRLTSLIGWNPFEQIENLSGIPNPTTQDSDKSLGIKALRPLILGKSGHDSSVSSFYVSTFNKGGGDTHGDGKPIKPGVEYFIGDFLSTGETKSSIDKLILLSENLDNLTSKLGSLLGNSLVKQKPGVSRNAPGTINTTGPLVSIENSSNVSSTDLVGIEGDSGNITNSAALVQRIFEEFSKALNQIYLDDLDFSAGNNFGESPQLLWFAAAANDPACAWEGLKYLLARDKLHRGDPNMGFNQLESISRSLLSQVIGFFNLSNTAQSRLTKYGFGYDGDGHPSEDTPTENNSSSQLNGPSSSDIGTDYDGPWFLLPSGDNLSATEMASKLGLSFSGGPQRAASLIPCLSDSIGKALDYWESEALSNFGVESDLSDTSAWKGVITDDLKMGRDGRLTLCYLFSLLVFQQTQKFAVWVPSTSLAQPKAFAHPWQSTKVSLSKRAIKSLHDANNKKAISSPAGWDLTGSKYKSFDDDSWNRDNGSGFKDNIEESINLFWSYYRSQLEYDILAWNSLYFLTEISDNVIETVNKIASAFSGDLSETSLSDIISGIEDSKGLPKVISAALTNDQVRLSRYLQSVLAFKNRDYPYLPASQAIMSNQAMCLGTLCQINRLVKTPESGKKRIFALGMPSGLIEFIRNSASDAMKNPLYNESNIIKISLWRRNLLNEEVCETPQEFLFDISRFIVEGRNVVGQGGADASSQFFEGQTVNDLLENTIVTQFNRDGIANEFKGKAYGDDTISNFNSQLNTLENLVDVMGNANVKESPSNVFKQIFNNHVLDHYLKLYLRITSGIDVGESIFCFLENETLINNSSDKDKKKIKNEITKILIGMYKPNDLAEGITFQRVLGELDRSVIMSPKKYRNRIIYPKIFDRVFCIIVDDADWIPPQPVQESENTSESGLPTYENTMSESTSTSSLIDPQYYQYFITVSIMTEIDPKAI